MNESAARTGSGEDSALARRERFWVVVTVMIGTVSTVLASTIVNVAFPALIRELRIGHDTLQWVATGFLAATTTTMLATAWLIERFGKRLVFVVALAVFLAASLLGALSWSAEPLITARVVQGAAAGVLQPLAMIALFEAFPPDRRGSAMSMFGFGIVLAPAVGPFVGGWLVDTFGWRSIFLLSVPFCVAGIALGLRTLSASRSGARHRYDWIGTALLIGSLVALLNVPVIGHRDGWLSWRLIGTALATVALIAGFIAWEFRTTAPLLALPIFSRPGFRATALVAFAYGLGLFGTTYLIPVFVQDVAAYTAGQAGYLLMPPGIALALAIAVAGRVTDRTHARYIVATGLLFFALSSFLFVFASASTNFWTLALWLVIGRIGLGMIIPALNVAAVQSLELAYLAHASATVNFVRQLGGAVGVNVLAVVLEWRLGVHTEAGGNAAAFHECFLLVTIAFAAALIPAWAIRKHSP